MAIPKGADKGKGSTPKKKHGNSPVKSSTSAGKGGKKSAGTTGALNPPFDTRMRRVGSPLNHSASIKRGWIETGHGGTSKNKKRVNFLFNPSQLEISHATDPATIPGSDQTITDTVTSQFVTSPVGSLTLSLLYDRTYELFSKNKGQSRNAANRFGVFADVAAWYYYHKMIESLPAGFTEAGYTGDWYQTMMTSPLSMVYSTLYVGQNMVYYGWVTSIDVVYTHWTEQMVPIRCGVTVGFSLLPSASTKAGMGKGKGVYKNGKGPNNTLSWSSDFSSDSGKSSSSSNVSGLINGTSKAPSADIFNGNKNLGDF